MSLTQKAEQMLTAGKLIEFFDKDQKPWQQLAKETYVFVASHFPAGATVRQDDVALALIPLLDVNKSLNKHLQANRLTQRYWISHFADLILDRTWDTINN